MTAKTWAIMLNSGVQNTELFDGMTAEQIAGLLKRFFREPCDYTLEDLRRAGKEIAEELIAQ